MDSKSFIEYFLSPKGPLSKVVPNFEFRTNQIAMALKIWDSLINNKIFMAEAGTGTGKSLAYLLPAIMHSRTIGMGTVIATYTRILQHQLIQKDIPIINQALQKIDIPPIKAVPLFGEKNYICLIQLDKMKRWGILKEDEASYFRKNIIKGEYLIEDEPEYIKKQIGRDSSRALGKKCPYFTRCFYHKIRKEIKEADIAVVNQSLFFSLKPDALPQGGIIFDEAHHLEDVIANSFGVYLSEKIITNFLDYIYNKKKGGILNKLPIKEAHKKRIVNTVMFIRNEIVEMWDRIKQIKAEERKKILKEPIDLRIPVLEYLKEFKEIFSELKSSDETVKQEYSYIQERTEKIINDFAMFTEMNNENMVYWIENEGKIPVLRSALIDVKEVVNERLIKPEIPVILTSATISVKGKFDFFANSTGFKNNGEIYPSPFCKKNIKFFIPDIPPPNSKLFKTAIKDIINKLIEASQGRSLILTTSFDMLTFLKENIHSIHNIYVQGDMEKKTILKRFKNEEEAILIATMSFWEGIDIPGTSLISTIITKLPFESPDEPRAFKKINNLKEKGRDGFYEYSLPRAIIKLKQGVGRLIRHKTDKGLVSILDVRIYKKYYGRYFISEFKDIEIMRSLKEATEYLSSLIQ